MNINFRNALSALMLVSASVTGFAQSMTLLGVFNDGTNGQIKAEINLEGKEIQTVTSYSYRMYDGYNTTSTDYELIDGRYLTADIDFNPGDYAYRIKVDFTDGSTLLSECIDKDYTEAFMWLGDYPFQTAVSGWSGRSPRVDISVDNTNPPSATPTRMTVNDTIYYKGVSNHAQGHVSFIFDRPFTRFVTRYGIQDDKAVGNLTYAFWNNRIWNGTGWTGGSAAVRQKMYSKTNSARGENPCIRDLELDMTDKNSLYIEALSDGSNGGDHAHLLLSRLYTQLPDNSGKSVQTVSFITQGGQLPVDADRLRLEAEASSGGGISYRIISGRDLARIENGDELVAVYGSKGDIVVEATQYGDDSYLPATAYITFSADFQPIVEMLATYPSAVEGVRMAYFLIDTKGHDLKQLDLQLYDNPYSLTPLDPIDLTDYFEPSKKGEKQIVSFPFNASDEVVHRFTYDIDGLEAPVTTVYRQGQESFEYLSDLTYRAGTGWDHWTADIAYDRTSSLQIGDRTYAKGFGTHAVGYVESTCDLSKYDRFVVDVGGQTISNTTRGKLNFALKSASNGAVLLNTGNVDWRVCTEWDYKLNGLTKVYILCGNGGDGNTNDVACVGAPRFYYPATIKKSQAITWTSEVEINECRPIVIPLEAEAESGLDVIYVLTEGEEYARIEDGNKLNVFNIPSDSCRVTVMAYQPGDETWAASDVHTCVFRVANHVVVAQDERVELEGPLSVKEMTVFADNLSSGQVLVKSGLVSVEKMSLKYTFRPGEWTYIAFPSDMNLDEVSDLNDKGYYFNNTREGAGGYYISSYNTRLRSDSDVESPWETLTSPAVKGLKGYIMCVDGGLGDDPVEITFTMNNLELDLSSTIRPIHLTLDMSYSDPGSEQAVYVRPANVKGNTLKVNVKFKPSDEWSLPVNHAHALKSMRVTYTPRRTGIRLTLPDQTPARVGIFDEKGEKLLKAVNYVAPMMIDLSDLSKGKYVVAVVYGPASAVREIEL